METIVKKALIQGRESRSRGLPAVPAIESPRFWRIVSSQSGTQFLNLVFLNLLVVGTIFAW